MNPVTVSENSKTAVLYRFFNQFLPAYPFTSVPRNDDGVEDVVFPYATYEVVTGSFDDGELSITLNLWFYTTSEAIPDAKAQEISDYIGSGGMRLPCDGGYIWIKRGTPWCQNLSDDAAPGIKRRYINITVEYLTEN